VSGVLVFFSVLFFSFLLCVCYVVIWAELPEINKWWRWW